MIYKHKLGIMTSLNLQKTELQPIFPNSFNGNYLRYIINQSSSKLLGSSMMICLFSFALFFTQNAMAQEYSDSVVFGDSDEYAFDYTIVCSGDGTTATVTADFTLPPDGLVPQIHLGGGVFVGMAGPNPYTYTITGLTGCEFSFQFWMAYAGGLYSSEFLTPTNAPNALPIELISISATKSGSRTTNLEWHTATEINSDYFGVERSIDGSNWKSIDQVRAQGNSYTNLSYTYLDSDLSLGNKSEVVFYYRLKMTDLDGTYEYSDITSVEFGNRTNRISVFPNPTSNFINVNLKDIYGQTDGAIQLVLYNDSGNEVMIKKIDDTDIESVDVTDLPSGTYFVVITQGRETLYQSSIVKIK